MVAADKCPSGMPRLLPALAGCLGVVTGVGRQIPNPQPMLGWGPFGESFDARSAQRGAAGVQPLPGGPAGAGGAGDRASGYCPGAAPLARAAVAGPGTSAGSPARWSVLAGSCTRSHLKKHRRHPDWPIRIGPADASPSKQWHNRPAWPSGLRRSPPPPRMHLPSAPSCARGRLAGARHRPGANGGPGPGAVDG
jgi:hypothetical protein